MSLSIYLCEDDERDLDAAVQQLSVEDRARVSRITAPHRLREFVLGRLLARHALRHDVGEGAWQLRAARSGRPSAYTADGRAHHAINLSHSHGLVVCAIAKDAELPLGCDVEFIRPRSEASWRRVRNLDRSHPVFSRAERGWLCSFTDEARDAHLFLLWTLKEAIAKATGHGIFRGRLSELSIDGRTLAELLASDPSAIHELIVDGRWHLQFVRLDRHWLAVATTLTLSLRTQWLQVRELLG